MYIIYQCHISHVTAKTITEILKKGGNSCNKKREIIYINVIFHITVKTNTEKLKREVIATGIKTRKGGN